MSENLTVFDVDFTDYERSEGGAAVRIPEADYLMRFTKVEMVTVKNENSENFGKPGWLVTLQIVNGPHAGVEIQDRFYPTITKTKFRIDQFLSAFGVEVKPGQMQVPVGQLMNRTLTVSVKDGKPYGEKQIVKSEVKKYAHASKSEGVVKSDGASLDADGVDL